MESLAITASQRRSTIRTNDTDALRLVDGAGDGIPGIIVEEFAGRMLVSTPGATNMPVWLPRWLGSENRPVYQKMLDAREKQSPEWRCGGRADEPFEIRENGVRFEVSFAAGYSQGIFLDQRDNRAEARRRMAPGMKLLNTFAYTGGFSVCAAIAGAETTTLDLSQPSLDWARRNFTRNGLDPARHHFCKGDTFHWLARFARQKRRFDGIVLDPPTFSRDHRGRVFRVETDFGELAALAAGVLAPGGWLLCCTNFRKLAPMQFERQILAALPRPAAASHRPMPPDFTDRPYLKSLWLQF
jgi:23S rRNA (cytosine1962-C5)-methyltransferase